MNFKKYIVVLSNFLMLLILSSCAQQGQQNLLRGAVDGVPGLDAGQIMRTALTNSEVVDGLKEALANGVETAINTLGKPGGFVGNSLVEIAIPKSLDPIASAARGLGQGQYIDSLEATMNQAAEQAVPKASSILADAIRAMSVDDAMAILEGKDDAATRYFQKVSEAKLAASFKPIVKQATDQVGVTSAYKDLTSQAGPLLSMVMTDNKLDLDDYITNEALDGLFIYIAQEEKRIRENPAARVTDVLKRVFGG